MAERGIDLIRIGECMKCREKGKYQPYHIIWGIKKYPNLRTRFAENMALEVSKKIFGRKSRALQ